MSNSPRVSTTEFGSQTDQAGWSQCSPGDLQRYAKVARRQSSVEALRRGLAIAAPVAIAAGLLVFVSLSLLGPNDQVGPKPSVGNGAARYVACWEAIERVDEYLAGTLDVSMRTGVREHVANCPHCRQLFEARARELGVELIVQRRPHHELPRHAEIVAMMAGASVAR